MKTLIGIFHRTRLYKSGLQSLIIVLNAGLVVVEVVAKGHYAKQSGKKTPFSLVNNFINKARASRYQMYCVDLNQLCFIPVTILNWVLS